MCGKPRAARPPLACHLRHPVGSSRIDRAELDDNDQYKQPCGEIKAECGNIVIYSHVMFAYLVRH